MKLFERTILVRAPAKYSVQKSGNERKRNDARAQECVYELHELQREGALQVIHFRCYFAQLPFFLLT